MLLIIQRPEETTLAVEQALAASGCVRLEGALYTMPTGAGGDDALRRVVEACAQEGGSVWLFAELEESARNEAMYRPLRDRSEDHAAAVAAWRDGRGPLPALDSGELLRL